MGPGRDEARGHGAVVERRAGHPRAHELPAHLRPHRARDPRGPAEPTAVDRRRARDAAARRPSTATAGPRRERWPPRGGSGTAERAGGDAAAPAGEGRGAGLRAALEGRHAEARVDPSRRPRAGGAARAGAPARRPRRAALALRPAAVGPRRASRACSASRPCWRSSSPRRSGCTATTACRCWPASASSRASISRPTGSAAGCASCRPTTRRPGERSGGGTGRPRGSALERYALALGLRVG